MTPQHLPKNACDCHTHVFPPAFGFDPARRYTPPFATVQALRDVHSALGIERVVLVQPSVYGTDNTATGQAISAFGLEHARGVAVIDPDMTSGQLRSLHAEGFRGVRVNLDAASARDTGRPMDRLNTMAHRIADLGWHIQIFAPLEVLAECVVDLQKLPCTLVLDHFAGAGLSKRDFRPILPSVLPLIASGKAYVKLSAAYRCVDSTVGEPFRTLLQTFLSCNADRLVWGSDWPHPNPSSPKNRDGVNPNFSVDLAGAISTIFQSATSTQATRKIFVDNPARLYDFPSTTK